MKTKTDPDHRITVRPNAGREPHGGVGAYLRILVGSVLGALAGAILAAPLVLTSDLGEPDAIEGAARLFLAGVAIGSTAGVGVNAPSRHRLVCVAVVGAVFLAGFLLIPAHPLGSMVTVPWVLLYVVAMLGVPQAALAVSDRLRPPSAAGVGSEEGRVAAARSRLGIRHADGWIVTAGIASIALGALVALIPVSWLISTALQPPSGAWFMWDEIVLWVALLTFGLVGVAAGAGMLRRSGPWRVVGVVFAILMLLLVVVSAFADGNLMYRFWEWPGHDLGRLALVTSIGAGGSALVIYGLARTWSAFDRKEGRSTPVSRAQERRRRRWPLRLGVGIVAIIAILDLGGGW